MPVTCEDTTERYGRVVYECIGILNFALLATLLDGNEYRKWVRKYHPMNFSIAYIMETLVERKNCSDYGTYAFFVPTEQMNLDWKPQETLYGADTNYKVKKLPFITPLKQIQKWQNSVPNNVLLPNYFYAAKTVDDLKIAAMNNVA